MSTPWQRPQQEHERKFLVSHHEAYEGEIGQEIYQAYLWGAEGYSIRIRLITSSAEVADEDALCLLTLKGPRMGFTRMEIEAPVPTDDAFTILAAVHDAIHKTRYSIVSEGNAWIVDRYHDMNEGLVIAEFEGSLREVQFVHRPWWCSAEVTEDSRFLNENLAARPWTTWSDDERSFFEPKA